MGLVDEPAEAYNVALVQKSDKDDDRENPAENNILKKFCCKIDTIYHLSSQSLDEALAHWISFGDAIYPVIEKSAKDR